MSRLAWVSPLLVTGILLIVACGEPADSLGANEPTAPAQPTSTVVQSPTTAITSPEDAAIAAAKALLSARLSIPEEEIDVKIAEAREWSDTALGCPEPGKSYAEVITPGYLVELQARGQTYEVHTDTAGNAVMCEEAATPSPGSISDGSMQMNEQQQQAYDAAMQALSGEKGISPGSVQLVSMEAVNWPDSSLGCPQPGMMYTQVITPGYKFVLSADGQEYSVHTDTGGHAVVCEQ